MLQYDDSKVAQMKTLFDAMPDNTQVKTLYRDAVTQKLIYLTLLEDAAWAKIGYANRKNKTDGHVISSDEYADKVEEAIKKAAQVDIDQSLNQRNDSARIGLSKLPLLLTFNPAAADGTQPTASGTDLTDPAQMQEILAKLKDRAHKNFEIRADYVRDIARQKQDVLCELVTLTPVTALNTHNPTDPIYDFYLINAGDNAQVLLRLELNVKTGNATIGELYADGMPVDQLKQQTLSRNSFLVERNPEITDILMEVSAAADRVFNQHKGAFSTPAPQPNTPKP